MPPRKSYGRHGLPLGIALLVAGCAADDGARPVSAHDAGQEQSAPDAEQERAVAPDTGVAMQDAAPEAASDAGATDGGSPRDVDEGRPDGGAAEVMDAAKPVDAADAVPEAAAPYAPCPASGSPCAVLPLGDSITDGAGSSGGGYRPPLFHLANVDHKSLTFVGTAMNGPTTVDGVAFPRRHEGHSGYTIDHGGPGNRQGLSTDIDLVNVIKTTKPHIVTLMIGTNDVDTNFDLANAPQRLGKLMDLILDADPKLLLIVAQMVPTTNDAENVKVRAYNAGIPALVSARASAGKHVAMVDMYAAFTANAAYKTAYMNDNLHPKDPGYAVMASTWYAAIRDLLP